MADASDTQSIVTTTDAGDDLLDLDDAQLARKLDYLQQANEILEAETNMFEKHLGKIDPHDLQQTLKGSNFQLVAESGSGTASSQGFAKRKRTKSRSSVSEKSLRLTAEQKADLALREIEELRLGTEKLQDEAERTLDHYRAILEECQMRLTETRKQQYEFERDLVRGATKKKTGQISAEAVVRYFDDSLRERMQQHFQDALVDKLRLKNQALRVQKRKLLYQLKQKEEMGEVLHEVDFNQLKIENQQYLEKIDERNQDLLKLKLMAGNTMQVLNSYKKKLNNCTKESDRYNNEISTRKELLKRIDSELKVVEQERGVAEQQNRKLREQLDEYKVPEVINYVQEKARVDELELKARSMDRKVEIAEMALKIHQKTWQQMKVRAKSRHAVVT